MSDKIAHVTQSDQWKYHVVDPFRQTRAFNTETQGRLAVGTTDYMKLSNPETVAEIKENAPWIQAFPVPQKKLRDGLVAFTVPELPFETTASRRQAELRAQREAREQEEQANVTNT